MQQAPALDGMVKIVVTNQGPLGNVADHHFFRDEGRERRVVVVLNGEVSVDDYGASW